jgi:multidrug efflux pump subunit AcrA (membrane-fusion protein)
VNFRNKNNNLIKGIFTFITIGLAISFLSISCQSQKGKKVETRINQTVAVITVGRNIVNRSVELFGSVYGDLQVTVSPKIAGRITQIVRPEGSTVNQGDTILYILNDIPGMDYQPGAVLSPISGTVGKINVEVGQNVSPATTIATISNYSNNVRVKAPISDQDLPYVKKGANAEISITALPGMVFQGKVTNLTTVVDQMSGSATVEITLPNHSHKLIPGMAASAKLTLEQKNDVITLPNAALFTNGSSKVLIVQDGIARMKEIKLGLVGNDYTEVLSGLAGGEKAVTIGKERVSDGDKVNVIEESAQ